MLSPAVFGSGNSPELTQSLFCPMVINLVVGISISKTWPRFNATQRCGTKKKKN